MAGPIEKWFANRRSFPFREMTPFEDSFDRMMSKMMNSNQGLISNFKPDCEVAEEENKYIFKFDLPGVKKEQVHVEVNNDQITVTAERKEEKKHESKRKFFSEFNYGSFTRSFNLPGKLDEKKVDAKFEDGVLTVTVPKSEKSTAKQISIQ